jgi:hypothetical protein
MLRAWFIVSASTETSHEAVSLFHGVVSGFIPWLLMKILDRGDKFGFQLQGPVRRAIDQLHPDLRNLQCSVAPVE